MSEEQLMKEIIKEQTQKIINLEQYLRIEKEVSDETIKELEQQVKEKDSVIADLHELKSEKFAMKKKINELEKENQELIENITEIGIDKIHLEQQKAELMEIAREYSHLLLSQQLYDFNNEHDLKRGEEIEAFLENIT